MAHQTRKYSRLTNFIQEVKFIYNIYKMYSIFFKYIQDIYLLFKIFKIHSRVLDMKKKIEYEKKNSWIWNTKSWIWKKNLQYMKQKSLIWKKNSGI